MLFRGLFFILIATLSGQQAVSKPLTWRTIDGEVVRLSHYQGRWVVLNFWATWCPPCLEELPHLSFFHELNRRHAVVLGLNVDTELSNREIKTFLSTYDVTFPVLRSDRRLQGFGRIPVIPTTFLVSPQGRVVKRITGPVTGDDLSEWIREHNPDYPPAANESEKGKM